MSKLLVLLVLAVAVLVGGDGGRPAQARAVNGSGLGAVPSTACRAPNCRFQIIVGIDSYLAGGGSPQPPYPTTLQTYPYYAMVNIPALIAADPTFNPSTNYVNCALAGQTMSAVASNSNNSSGPFGNGYGTACILAAINATAAGRTPIVLLHGGTNDLANQAGNVGASGPAVTGQSTPARLLQDLTTTIGVINAGTSRSWRSICTTVPDRTQGFFSPTTVTTFEAALPVYAGLLNATGTRLCSAILDWYATPTIYSGCATLGTAGCANNPTVYIASTDTGIHWSITTDETIAAPAIVAPLLAIGGGR